VRTLTLEACQPEPDGGVMGLHLLNKMRISACPTAFAINRDYLSLDIAEIRGGENRVSDRRSEERFQVAKPAAESLVRFAL